MDAKIHGAEKYWWEERLHAMPPLSPEIPDLAPGGPSEYVESGDHCHAQTSSAKPPQLIMDWDYDEEGLLSSFDELGGKSQLSGRPERAVGQSDPQPQPNPAYIQNVNFQLQEQNFLWTDRYGQIKSLAISPLQYRIIKKIIDGGDRGVLFNDIFTDVLKCANKMKDSTMRKQLSSFCDDFNKKVDSFEILKINKSYLAQSGKPIASPAFMLVPRERPALAQMHNCYLKEDKLVYENGGAMFDIFMNSGRHQLLLELMKSGETGLSKNDIYGILIGSAMIEPRSEDKLRHYLRNLNELLLPANLWIVECGEEYGARSAGRFALHQYYTLPTN